MEFYLLEKSCLNFKCLKNIVHHFLLMLIKFLVKYMFKIIDGRTTNKNGMITVYFLKNILAAISSH